LVISDFLVLTDIVKYMSHEFRDKLKKLIFTGGSINYLMSYASSYPEFLTPAYCQRIYEEPPVYPFDGFEQLRERTLEGSLETISTECKVPLK
jgi:hypothetical protein